MTGDNYYIMTQVLLYTNMYMYINMVNITMEENRQRQLRKTDGPVGESMDQSMSPWTSL